MSKITPDIDKRALHLIPGFTLWIDIRGHRTVLKITGNKGDIGTVSGAKNSREVDKE